MYKPKKFKLITINILLSVFTIAMCLSINTVSATSKTNQAVASNIHQLSASSTAPKQVEDFAEQNRNRLARLNTFSEWSHAQIQVEPLGPGTHSWLASILQQKSNNGGHSKFIGYMVISIDENQQCVLVEYGLGKDSIYHPDKLSDALTLLGLSTEHTNAKPYYGGANWTEWSVANGSYIHAGTGEIVPQTQASWDSIRLHYMAPAGAFNSSFIESSILESDPIQSLTAQSIVPSPAVFTGQDFDPYDQITWMVAKPLQLESTTFLQALAANKQLIYVGSHNNQTYRIPFSITGYQKWGAHIIYVQAGSLSSPRFIAINELLASGRFIKLN